MQFIVTGSVFTMLTGSSPGGTIDDLSYFWNNDMASVFDLFANSLTRSMLIPTGMLGSSLGQDFVNGTVWSDRSFVDVRWPWIALPLSLNLLGIMFLVLSIVYTNKQKLPLWKSSLLAITYHGLRDESIDPLLSYTTESEMAEAASMTSVGLVATDGGRRLMLQS